MKHRTHKEFIEEMSKINPNVSILGHFNKMREKIKCKCNIHNYVWDAIPYTLLKGANCPLCAQEKRNVSNELHAQQAKEKFILNLKEKDIQLIGEYNGHHKHSKFKCLKCGFIWITSPHSINNCKGCPNCGLKSRIEKRSKTHEQFVSEMKVINPNIEILSQYKNSKTKIKYKCLKCGGIFESTPNHLIRSHGCPSCSNSRGELMLISLFNKYGIKYEAQVTVKSNITNTKVFRIDFVVEQNSQVYYIEYNGRQHYQSVEKFGGQEIFKKQLQRDADLRIYCRRNNINLIEIPFTKNTPNLIEKEIQCLIKMISTKDILISRDSLGKIRVVELSYYWNDALHGYVIERITYILNGKKVNQPLIVVDKPKAKRTLQQQIELEYNSNKKKYLDKGYKNIKDLGYSSLSEFDPDKVLGSDTTNQDGIIKPYLAKPADDVSNKAFNRQYYGSRKINGVRALIYCKEGVIKTASRGAITYDVAVNHIITHPKLIDLFKENPDLILDGEIYKHGWTLNKISGLARKEEPDEEQKHLEYYLYDIADTTKTFKDRLTILNEIKDKLNLDFDPEKEWNENDLKIQFVPQDLMQGWDQIKKCHDKFVSEGWEGLVIRFVNGMYKPGKRSSDMIKVKQYSEKEYVILGITEGLRPEDMCFKMKTSGGYEFNCKPVGDREQKQWYREHINEIIGKLATVKYFEMSGAGTDIPQQPVMLTIRWDADDTMKYDY